MIEKKNIKVESNHVEMPHHHQPTHNVNNIVITIIPLKNTVWGDFIDRLQYDVYLGIKAIGK